jgi:pimeloyl-ACP methyl ester carboxylesterase
MVRISAPILEGFGPASAEGKQSAKIEPVLLIHGTFANRRSNEWWQPKSDFCRQLDALLHKEGAAAQCWANIAPPFAWTGKNSELARREAGRALAAQLAALEEDNSIKRYHLIGHSHGGNVILNALGELPRNPKTLGAVVFLGTPALLFTHRELDPRWISIPLYIIVLPIIIWLFLHSPGLIFILISLTLSSLLFALLADLFFRPGFPRRLQAFGYGTGHPRAFVFPSDEAIASLVSAQQIIDDPKGFIDKFSRPEPEAKQPNFACEPTPAPTRFFEQIRQTGAFWELTRSVRTGHLSDDVKTHSEHLPDVKMLFAIEQWPGVLKIVPYTLLAFASAPSAIKATYSFTVRAVGKRVNQIVWFLATRLGRWVLPVLMRRAIFGQDQGSFLEVQRLPPDVSDPETITPALARKAEGLSQHLGQDAGQAILHAIARMDAFAIKSRVIDALANPALAHSYYYESREIREKIARLIATVPPSPPPWPTLLAPGQSASNLRVNGKRLVEGHG